MALSSIQVNHVSMNNAQQDTASMGKIDYDTRLHGVYAAGRKMSQGALLAWMDTLAGHVPSTRPLVWLDLGSGTGRLTPSLAAAFGGPVHGIEPSTNMRAQAIANAAHPAVRYAAGSAEHIPLPDAACDAALLFFVWHHVSDQVAAARELHRVVKPGGTVIVAGNLANRMPDVWWFRIVPEWKRIDRPQFQTEQEVERVFGLPGFMLANRDQVTWVRAANLTEDLDRLRLRSVSLFEHMSDEAAAAGFAKIDAALPSLDDGPQRETTPVLVFQRS
jgi:ubiquinone/menaquinone biosynthesis C-methylase UbiE